MSEQVLIGKVVGTFGLKGFLKVWPLTELPERFDQGKTVEIAGKEFVIRETQWHKKQVRIRLEGVSRISLAQALIGEEVTAAYEAPVLDEGQYLVSDLTGMAVFDAQGQQLGEIDEVIQSPAHDIYRVGDALIPAVSEFVKEVDTVARRIVVSPIPGMFEDAD